MEFANNTEFVLFIIMVGFVGGVIFMVGKDMLDTRNERHRQTARDLREIKTKLSLIESKLKNQVSSY